MNIIKRIWLFLLTNIAVIFLFSLVLYIIQVVFGFNLSAASGASYTWILIYAGIFGFIGSFFSLSISRWTAKKAYWIIPIKTQELSLLSEKERIVYDTVQSISEKAKITIPEVGIYQSIEPNAFATGPSKNKSLVACSSGLLQSMTPQEIEWVVAHEMSHVLNGDMVTMALLQWVMNTFIIFFARIIANIINDRTEWRLWNLSYFAVYAGLQVVFWIFASLVVNLFSRHREFRADAWSAHLVWKEKMIAALKSLSKMKELAPSNRDKLATLKINTKSMSWFAKIFMTHPPIEERISYLESLPIQ